MSEGSIPSLLVKFSLPAVVGMMVNALYNIVDRIFIGQGVGPLGLAGVTVGFPLMLIQMAFGMLIGLGANALISIKLGQQRKDEAERILGTATVLLIITSFIMSAFGLFFLPSLLRLFGASDAILPYAISYMRYILLGSIVQAISFGMNNFIRGEGNPRTAMKTMFIGAGLNILLNPIFIFVFKMGVAGAAIATVLSQTVSAIWVLSYFLSGKSLLKLHVQNMRIRKSVVLKILAIGSAPFAMHLVASVLNAILNNQLQKYGGDLAISIMGILYSISMLTLMPIFGINQGAQPIIGYNFGAERYDRVKKTLQLAISYASIIVFLGFLLTQLFPFALIKLFNHNDQALQNLGGHALPIFFLMLPLVGFQIVSANYFQAVGKPQWAILLTLSRQIIFFIPAMFVFPHFFQLDGIWMTAPFADFMSALLSGLFLIHEFRLLAKQANRA